MLTKKQIVDLSKRINTENPLSQFEQAQVFDACLALMDRPEPRKIDVKAVMAEVTKFGDACETMGSEPCPKAHTESLVDSCYDEIRRLLESFNSPT